MFNISTYLTKFKKIALPHDAIKTEIVRLLAEEIGVTVEKQRVEVKNKAIYLHVPPIIKTEVAMRKAFFLEKIAVIDTNTVIEDIR